MVTKDDFTGIINPGIAYEEIVDVGAGLFKHEVVRIVKVNVDSALRPGLERVDIHVALDLQGGVIGPSVSLDENGRDRGMVGYLFRNECDAAMREDKVVGLAEQRVEGLGGSVGGGSVLTNYKCCNEGGSVGSGGEMGLSSFVEQVVVLNIFGKTLQEGDGLVEEDGDCDSGYVSAEGVAKYGEEVRSLRGAGVGVWRCGLSRWRGLQ